MDQIFHDYHDRILTGDELLKEVYATYNNVSIKWLECENITIRDLVNRICNDYEDEGFDLDELPLVNIRERFMDFTPIVRVPPEYEQLVDAKNKSKEQLISITENKSLMNVPGIQDVIKQIKDTIESIDQELLKLV